MTLLRTGFSHSRDQNGPPEEVNFGPFRSATVLGVMPLRPLTLTSNLLPFLSFFCWIEPRLGPARVHHEVWASTQKRAQMTTTVSCTSPLFRKHALARANVVGPLLFATIGTEQSLGKGMRQSRNQWREAPFHWMGCRHSRNEDIGKEFYRKRNSVKRFWPFSESPDSKHWNFLRLISFPNLGSLNISTMRHRKHCNPETPLRDLPLLGSHSRRTQEGCEMVFTTSNPHGRWDNVSGSVDPRFRDVLHVHGSLNILLWNISLATHTYPLNNGVKAHPPLIKVVGLTNTPKQVVLDNPSLN